MRYTGSLLVLLFSFLLLTSSTSPSEEEGFWFETKEECMSYAQEKGKNILMVFSGSDWCKPCMQFKKEVLLSEEFTSYASEELAILYLDFPMKKKNRLSEAQTAHNEALAEEFNKNGAFPKIILLDAQLNEIKEIKYTRQNTSAFIESLE